MVTPHSAQVFVRTARESCRDRAGVRARLDRSQPIDFVRQNASRVRRFHLESRNEQNKMETRIDWKFLMAIMARDYKTAEFSRGRIIGMPFQLGAEPKNLSAFQRMIEERVQSVEHTEPHGYAAPKPAGPRHFAFDCAGKRERFAIRGLKKLTRSLACHCASFDLARARDRYEVIKPQGHAQAIETGAKIRGRGWNAHRDLLLFQKESAENTSKRGMAALILTWPVSAARQSEV
jgi:hypothetical protein